MLLERGREGALWVTGKLLERDEGDGRGERNVLCTRVGSYRRRGGVGGRPLIDIVLAKASSMRDREERTERASVRSSKRVRRRA